MTSVTLHHGDNRATLRRLIDEGVRVHSIVTDPPYGMTSITKRFGADKAAPAKFGKDGAFARASAGFMGSKWDGTGIERDPEFWRLIYDILLPGGYVVAFSAARTGHWQACAMEMAGFVMHPFLGWVYGQGFPKAHSAAMAIDKQLGVKGGRGEPKSAAHAGWIERGRMRGGDEAENNEGWQRPWMADEDKVAAAASKYVPGSLEAAQWEGWAYGGQALKPALEPIFVGQKPFSEKNGALNILKHGVGAINIEGCRVPIDPVSDASQMRTMARGQRTDNQNGQQWGMSKNSGDTPTVVRATGRHPANLLHDGSDNVVALFPQSAGQQAAVQGTEPSPITNEIYGQFAERLPSEPRGDTGSAARFFNSFPTPDESGEAGTSQEQFDSEGLQCEPIFYQGKATKADRAGSKHPTVKPIALMRWLCRLVTPPGGTVLDPFAGSGTTGAAAREEGFDCILMEAEDQFAADIRRRFGLSAPVCDEFDAMFAEADEFDVLFG